MFCVIIPFAADLRQPQFVLSETAVNSKMAIDDNRFHEGRMKDRLDTLLVKAGLAESKEQAQRLILAGEVRVAGQRATKPGTRSTNRCR